MKILHVLSQFEVTGAEAYAASLIEAQLADGHSVFVVSDTFTLPTNATYIPLPIGDRSYPRRIKNIRVLMHLIRQHSIDMVHAHSRAASWVSLFATRLTRTPLVSTVHGRQHVHTSSRAFSIYGKDIIAVSASLKEHLTKDLGLDSWDIVVIPNCINLDKWESERSSFAERARTSPERESLVMFVGRLTGPKGDVVRLLISSVLPSVLRRRKIRFQVIGGMITPDDIPLLVSKLNAKSNHPVVELTGFQKDLAGYMLKADLIIGSGRVVPESLVLRRPVIAFGESDYAGPITPSTFEAATETNFGDTGLPVPADPQRVADDIIRMLEHPHSAADFEALSSLTFRRFQAGNVATRIHRVYDRAAARVRSPQAIPVLMYHRVLESPPQGSSHGIWVSAQQFTSQLESLRRRGFQTITFRDYDRFLRREGTLPKRPIILTFDDGYVDNYQVAFPLLQKFGFKAVIYAVTEAERRTNFWDSDEPSAQLMTTSQMQELHRSGMEIGSHTMSHPHLPMLTPEEARCEIRHSKDYLEQVLGSTVFSFAYPYGELSEGVKNLVEESGYRFAVAADSGPITFYQDFLQIRRTQVFPWTDSIGFWKKTLPLYIRYKAFKS
jgi:peptidoglycan/xylan/chitin deacetylase (PgdA/CDA1 family)/glycosyltransferase involved in cell wall biosynthesis